MVKSLQRTRVYNKSKKLKLKTYSEYKDVINTKKEENNAIFGKYVISSLSKRKCLLLDGSLMQSTRYLLKKKILRKNRIHIIEHNLETTKIQKSQNLISYNNIHNIDIYDFLKNQKKLDFSCAYFDFQGTILGSSKFKPLEVILRFLERNVNDNIVLGLTFSCRQRFISSKEHENIEDFINFYLKNCVNTAKYAIVEHFFKTYRRSLKNSSMVFMTVHLQKDHSIDPELIYHPISDSGTFIGYFPFYYKALN